MANRIPVIVDTSTLRFSEIPANDNLDLAGCGIVNTGNLTSNTTINSTAVSSSNLYSYGTITSTTSVTGATLSGTTSVTSANIYAGGNINATDTITTNTIKPTVYQETFSNVLISSGTVTYDLTTASIFRTDLSNDIVTVNFTNPPVANTGLAFIIQIVGTGQNNTISWPAAVKYKDDTAPSINGNVGNVNSFVFYTTDGGTSYLGGATVGQY